ncbi:prephenate dehydrogenase [Granulosicoccus antarcticus]|uniref:prephenate dehydrogenase n=1 Tax=Granulosicoccus antarcticus IMCC3135 TaxID=1192854 RepID=A0A2Z2NZ68_9GAMM|nr:prephenate dehydrogenase/arogenate dehydrogenase family protein [Granulosicoccus antarcticus]ASJ75221.1 Prephenate dehydrogenase [Granulosicoccus antarcticus IMCC3135]
MNTLCIVGLGMIGGSLAGALKQANFPGKIVALVRSEATGVRGLELGLIDAFSVNAADVICDADVVMLAVPMLSMREQMQLIKEHLKPAAIVTDAGSVKAPFIKDARDVFGDLSRVVPGHPIAGREKTGVDAADASLYQNRRVLLTPLPETDAAATATVQQLWELVGAEVEVLGPEQHDRVLAATSHLPHVLAFALVDTLATQQEAEEIFRYAAGGFRDFTRIASSDAIMWRDVCLTNREAILESMDNLDAHLKQLRHAIDISDGEAIEATFVRARKARDANT